MTKPWVRFLVSVYFFYAIVWGQFIDQMLSNANKHINFIGQTVTAISWPISMPAMLYSISTNDPYWQKTIK